MCWSCEGAEVDIATVIQIESSGNPNAYNAKSGAIGLMQITPICYKDWEQYQSWKHNNPNVIMFNPEWNKIIGTWYLNTRIPQMLKAFKIKDTVEARLACYNAGIGVYKAYKEGKRKLPRETINYINKYHKLVDK